MTAASWFLLMTSIYGQQYLGPLSEPSCRMAAVTLASYGATCRQAQAATACAVPGQPGVYQACPVFDGIRVGAPPAE